MKKTYQHPQMNMVEVSMQQLLTESTDAPSVGGTTSNKNDLLSRDRNEMWDDEE